MMAEPIVEASFNVSSTGYGRYEVQLVWVANLHISDTRNNVARGKPDLYIFFLLLNEVYHAEWTLISCSFVSSRADTVLVEQSQQGAGIDGNTSDKTLVIQKT